MQVHGLKTWEAKELGRIDLLRPKDAASGWVLEFMPSGESYFWWMNNIDIFGFKGTLCICVFVRKFIYEDMGSTMEYYRAECEKLQGRLIAGATEAMKSFNKNGVNGVSDIDIPSVEFDPEYFEKSSVVVLSSGREDTLPAPVVHPLAIEVLPGHEGKGLVNKLFDVLVTATGFDICTKGLIVTESDVRQE